MKIVITGLGNIGSFLPFLLACLPGIDELLLVDPDRYSEKNLESQRIDPADVRRHKAIVQAEKIRRGKPSLKVAAAVRRVADVALGQLRAALIVGCVDSLIARMSLSEAAWRTGVPYMDCGVSADGRAVRVTLYVPGRTGCLECGWSESHYAALENLHACGGGEAAATGAPAALGAFAAGALALEVERFFAEWPEPSLAGRELRIYGEERRLIETGFAPNPRCRFDHLTLDIESIGADPSELTLAQAFAQGRGKGDALGVEPIPWVSMLSCQRCARRVRVAGLRGRPPVSRRRCETCGDLMTPVGSATHDRRRMADFSFEELKSPLAVFGFEPGEVFSLRGAKGDEKHFELSGATTRREQEQPITANHE